MYSLFLLKMKSTVAATLSSGFLWWLWRLFSDRVWLVGELIGFYVNYEEQRSIEVIRIIFMSSVTCGTVHSCRHQSIAFETWHKLVQVCESLHIQYRCGGFFLSHIFWTKALQSPLSVFEMHFWGILKDSIYRVLHCCVVTPYPIVEKSSNCVKTLSEFGMTHIH